MPIKAEFVPVSSLLRTTNAIALVGERKSFIRHFKFCPECDDTTEHLGEVIGETKERFTCLDCGSQTEYVTK